MESTERHQLVAELATTIKRWGLTAPAILLLEANKPFCFIASQLLLVIEPLLGWLDERKKTRTYARLLEDRENVEWLLRELER